MVQLLKVIGLRVFPSLNFFLIILWGLLLLVFSLKCISSAISLIARHQIYLIDPHQYTTEGNGENSEDHYYSHLKSIIVSLILAEIVI